MKDVLKRHIFIVSLCSVFFLVAAILICTWYKYQLNPDATAYISIAEKYARGDFRHAINGYWGPLLSWLLTPSIWLGLNPIIAAKLIAALAATGILVTIYIALLRRKVSRPIIYGVTTALSSTMIIWVTVEAITPDVLLTCFVTLFAVLFVDFLAKPTRNQGIYLGVLGAAMYFAKGFGFFFFIGVVGLTAAYYWLRVDKNFMVVVKRYAPIAITFGALVLPFIAVISIKYHAPTINNAGVYDRHIHGYHGAKTATDPPIINTAGPLEPTNSTAMNAWEDPSRLTHLVPGWSPLDTRDTLHYFVFGTIGKNLNQALRLMYTQVPLAVIGLGALVLGILQRKHFQREYTVFTFMIALMVCGYALVLIEVRYLWASITISAMGLALFASFMQKKKVLSALQIIVVGAIITALNVLASGQVIAATRNTDREWLLMSNALQKDLPANTHIMSDDFARSYHICYYLKLKCYNVLSPPNGDQQVYYESLRHYGVSYIIDFHTRDNEPALQQFIKTYLTPIGERMAGSHNVTLYKVN